jgi:hypothetical protein
MDHLTIAAAGGPMCQNHNLGSLLLILEKCGLLPCTLEFAGTKEKKEKKERKEGTMGNGKT